MHASNQQYRINILPKGSFSLEANSTASSGDSPTTYLSFEDLPTPTTFHTEIDKLTQFYPNNFIQESPQFICENINCPKCPLLCKEFNDLQYHMKKCHSRPVALNELENKTSDFPCQDCERNFYSQYKLKKHKTILHKRV